MSDIRPRGFITLLGARRLPGRWPRERSRARLLAPSQVQETIGLARL